MPDMPTLAQAFPAQPQPQIPLRQAGPMLGQNTSGQDWMRADGTKKGNGFFGPLKFHDGRVSTELSIGVGIGGKETEIPALVPTLTKEEIDHLLKGGEPTDAIVKKAVEHAMRRMKEGLPVFATEADKPIAVPQ